MGSILDDLAQLTGSVGVPAAAGATPGPASPHTASLLGGQGLRYFLSLGLLQAGELTVAQLVERVSAAGYLVVGRASKVVSDALRWEVGHGRVVRVGRGRYRTGRIPRSTRWWMVRSLERWRERGCAALEAAEAAEHAEDAENAENAEGGTLLDVPPAPSSGPDRRGFAPPSGLTRYRRQQRRRRAWEATLGPKPTFRRWLITQP